MCLITSYFTRLILFMLSSLHVLFTGSRGCKLHVDVPCHVTNTVEKDKERNKKMLLTEGEVCVCVSCYQII